MASRRLASNKLRGHTAPDKAPEKRSWPRGGWPRRSFGDTQPPTKPRRKEAGFEEAGLEQAAGTHGPRQSLGDNPTSIDHEWHGTTVARALTM